MVQAKKTSDKNADTTATSSEDIPKYERRNQDDGAQYKRSIYALDVNVQVVIGTARPTIGELLLMKRDSLLPLDCKLEDPVELVIDSRVIARGDLIETDPETGAIGVKLTEIVDISGDMLK